MRFYIPVTVTGPDGRTVTEGTASMARAVGSYLDARNHDLMDEYQDTGNEEMNALMRRQLKHIYVGVEAIGDRLLGTVDLVSRGPVTEDILTEIIPTHIFRCLKDGWGKELHSENIPVGQSFVRLSYDEPADWAFHNLMSKEQIAQMIAKETPYPEIPDLTPAIREMCQRYPYGGDAVVWTGVYKMEKQALEEYLQAAGAGTVGDLLTAAFYTAYEQYVPEEERDYIARQAEEDRAQQNGEKPAQGQEL